MINFGQCSNLTTVNVIGLPDLHYLQLTQCGVTSIDVSTLANLKTFLVEENNLTTIDFSHNYNLEVAAADHNQLTSVTLPNGPNNITVLYLGSNLLTSVDCSNINPQVPGEYHDISLSDNPNLVYVNLKNNWGSQFDAIDCPQLKYICSDDYRVEELTLQMENQGNTDTQVNSYCSFVPGGEYNTITGNVTFDFNGNGCDTNDSHFPDIKMSMNDGLTVNSSFTMADGHYVFYTYDGSFVIAPVFENPYFTVTPTTVDFAVPGGLTQTQNFCITPNGIHNDLEITYNIYPIRPGFDAYSSFTIKNKGNQIQSGNINLNFNDSLLDFVSSTPSIDTQSENNITWNFSGLQPFETRTYDLMMNANAPTETPALNINDILNFTASINTSEIDETPSDNTVSLQQTVIGSFDPNDKTCAEGATITPEKVGDYLHYLIRFQNSGTAAAENIVVKDIIDTEKYDMDSFQLVETSHPQMTRITDNKVEFIFENINLPAEADNALGSQGYVSFKIKTKDTLVLGDTISNTADIFFDYNFPIITNPAITTVSLLGVNQFENTNISIAPNPVKNQLQISAKEIITSVQIFDLQGRLIETALENSPSMQLDFSGKRSGVYFVKVFTAGGMKVQKIIKE